MDKRDVLTADAGTRVALARSHFFNDDPVPKGLVDEAIEKSWRRCASQGLNAFKRAPISVYSQQEFQQIKERNRLLAQVALPELENLYQQIANTRSVVLLADTDATILSSLGSPLSIEDSSIRKVSNLGACWSEEQMGTNAIGTTIIEQRAVSIFGGEHYLEQHNAFSCWASPIFDPYGKLVGVLDVSSRKHLRQMEMLVNMSAQLIENRLFHAHFKKQLIVRFHNRPEFLGTLWEAIAVFSLDGRLLALNRAALLLLNISHDLVTNDDFSSIFDYNFEHLSDYFSVSGRSPLLVYMRNGVRVYTSAHPVSPMHPEAGGASAAAKSSIGNQTGIKPEFSDIALGEKSMAALIEKAQCAFTADIPILLEGETGCGKEVLARALHQHSSRAARQFIAINCASIPETLIEAELFGYREGAFTGAKRGGAIGKLQLADKGTLFLDEIGDMPHGLQARLLRVLQEREITPLGSDKVIPIDIAIICASHMNLKERVTKGLFREDLYYRLNGLRVPLPPLRERKNLREIIAHLIQRKVGSTRQVVVSEEVFDAFRNHPWPGNIRQLSSVLATALAFLGEKDCIELQHLTDDFLNELIERRNHQAATESDQVHAHGTGTLASMEAQAIRTALERHGGNISASAAALNISRATLYRKIKQFMN